LSLSTWSHVACVRSGSTFTVYVNGTASGTPASNAGALNSNALAVRIGRTENTGTSRGILGYVSNLRIVNGTAVYTSTFAPPTTPLTAIANTSLLTCQSPTFIDNSINEFAITATGSPLPTTVNPFGFTNTSSEYSTTTFGGSAYFDGSGDYLSNGPYNGQSNFTPSASTAQNKSATIEFWIYPTSTGEGRPYSYCTSSIGAGNDIGIFCYLFGSAQSYNVRFGWYNQTVQYAVTGGAALPYTWTHIAFTYNPSGGVGTLYVNGVSVGTVTGGNVNGGPPNTINGAYNYIGFYPAPGYFTGYMSNFRYILGSMLYTSNFAPPIAPVTAVANTTMLLNFTNAGIIDNAMITDIETNADAKISTTQSKYGTSSIAFDGTGDYLKIPGTNQIVTFGTGDFTVEFWVYLITVPTDYPPILTNDNGFYINFRGNGNIALTDISNQYAITASALTAGSWFHVAIVRNSGSSKVYVNGIGGTAVACTVNWAATTTAYIGGSPTYTTINGYIDDLRVTSGYARYTSTFTPPTSQLAGK
jgi:hypothetical protein